MQSGLGRNPFIKGAASLPSCYRHLYFSRLPIPDSRFPTPDFRLLTPDSLLPKML
ncbi:MAG: hypothetical protein F6K55_07150 [Moorea sp. SIO4A3]|nr:hypothetical protein [Moorena sp. SIO4A3]